MPVLRQLSKNFAAATSDESFLKLLKTVETIAAKILSLAMVAVLFVSVVDLIVLLSSQLAQEPIGFFNVTLIELFGLFLNILIALEILENITAYLKKHVIQVELVLATSLTAVARKIIIFDIKNTPATYLIGLGVAVIALSLSYWIVRRSNRSFRNGNEH